MMMMMMMMIKDDRWTDLSCSSPRVVTLYFNERWLIWANDVVAQVRYYCGHRRRWHRRQSIYDDTHHLYREMALAQLFNEGMGCQIFQQDRAPPCLVQLHTGRSTKRNAKPPTLSSKFGCRRSSHPSLLPFFMVAWRPFFGWRCAFSLGAISQPFHIFLRRN